MGTESTTTFALAVRELSVPIVPNEIPIGAKIGAVFVSIFVLGSTGSGSGLIDWYLWKNKRQASGVGTRPTPGNTGVNKFRSWILHEEKGLAATQDGTPMVFKGVIKIPRSFQRMGEDDAFDIVLLAPGADLEFCVKVIYKWYQ